MDAPKNTGQGPAETSSTHARMLDDVYGNPQELSRLLTSNFNKLDRNGDGIITASELKDVASLAPNTQVGNVAKTALKHFDYLARLDGDVGANPVINSRDVERFKSIVDPSQCEALPSFAETVAGATAGGALGGGVGSKVSGGKFSDGAGKGAAIGAGIGTLAYLAKQAEYNSYVNQRQPVDAWSEFRAKVCDGDKPTPNVSLQSALPNSSQRLDQTGRNLWSMHNLVASLDHHPKRFEPQSVAQFQLLKKDFAALDTDHDGYLSQEELAAGVASTHFSRTERDIMAVVGDNIQTVARLGAPGPESGQQVSMSNLAAAAEIYEKPDASKVQHHHHIIEGGVTVGAVVGCIAGGAIGMLAGSPEIGCPVGAVVLAGGGGLGAHKFSPLADPLGDRIGKEEVEKLRSDLRAINAYD